MGALLEPCWSPAGLCSAGGGHSHPPTSPLPPALAPLGAALLPAVVNPSACLPWDAGGWMDSHLHCRGAWAEEGG